MAAPIKHLADWQVSAILSEPNGDGYFCEPICRLTLGLAVPQHGAMLRAWQRVRWGDQRTQDSMLRELEAEGLA